VELKGNYQEALARKVSINNPVGGGERIRIPSGRGGRGKRVCMPRDYSSGAKPS
jgi:hypothetical protein